jgi:hypothetical protein
MPPEQLGLQEKSIEGNDRHGGLLTSIKRALWYECDITMAVRGVLEKKIIQLVFICQVRMIIRTIGFILISIRVSL